MAPRKRILCLVDYKYRDLPGLALIKVLLEAHGLYDVILAPNLPRQIWHTYLRQYQPNMVVVSAVTKPIHAALTYHLQRTGIGVVLVPTEGMAYTEDGQLHAAGKGADFGGLDLIFLWNETIGALARQHGTVPPGRAVVGGVPRFDFYRAPWNALIASKQEFCKTYRLDWQRPIISWSTNFWFTYFAGKPREIERAIAGLREGNSPHWRDFPVRIEKELESRAKLTATVFRIAREFPSTNLVIKIHPSERRDWYDEQVRESGLSNVHVIDREYISHVLNSVDLHLHTSCTTGIEAWLLDKPTIDMQFPQREWFHAPQMFAGGHVADSPDECFDQVRYYLTGGSLPAEQAAARPGIIEWFCGIVDGRSALRHAEAMHRWLQQSNRELEVPRLSFEDVRFEALTRVKSLLGLQPYDSLKTSFSPEGRDPLGRCFTPQELGYWVEGIQRVSTVTPEHL